MIKSGLKMMKTDFLLESHTMSVVFANDAEVSFKCLRHVTITRFVCVAQRVESLTMPIVYANGSSFPSKAYEMLPSLDVCVCVLHTKVLNQSLETTPRLGKWLKQT